MASTNKLIFFFLCIFSSSVFSSAQLSVDFKATSFQQLLKTNTGLLTSTKFSARNVAGRAVYGLRTVPIGKAIVGNVLKNRSFSPWGLAITAAITAAGYYLNQNTGEVGTPGNVGVNANEKGRCLINLGSGDIDQSNKTLTQCDTLFESHPQYGNWTGTYVVNVSDNICYPHTSGPFIGCWYPSNDFPNPIPDEFLSTDFEPISDDEVYDSVIPNFSESQISDALKDPQTGLPDEDLTPLVDSAADLTSDYDAVNDGDPNTNPSFDTENDTGDDTFTEDETQLPNEDIEDQQQDQTQQDQCELTPDALGCQEFGDELTEVDIPTEELSFSFAPVSLASDTSCPAPSVLNLTYGSVSLSNQPLCDFFTGVNPVVISVCSLLAIYILTGGVQRG